MTDDFQATPETATDSVALMSDEAPTAARPALPGGLPSRPPSAGGPQLYRSVADGELKTAWTLSEYFASLNTVLRLPTRARRKQEETKKQAAAAAGVGAAPSAASGPRTMPLRPVLLVAAAVAVVVLVGQALRSGGGGGEVADLTPALGTWEAENGSYAGRTFELGPESIVFRTGASATDLSRHKVMAASGKTVADSTLYTVRYDEQGRESEFSFWYVGGARPVIRLKNKPSVAWHKATPKPVGARKS
jgi:hypothetical protein